MARNDLKWLNWQDIDGNGWLEMVGRYWNKLKMARIHKNGLKWLE